MKLAFRYIPVLIPILALSGCAGLGLNQTFPPAEAAVPAPGERWSYRVVNGYNKLEIGRTRHEVAGVGAGRFEVRVTDEGTSAGVSRGYLAGWNPESGSYPVGLAMAGFWTGIPPGAPVRYAPALPAFRFPLAAGQGWRETVTVTDPATGMQVPVLVIASVQGMERVKVPAGEFDAIKVQRYLYYKDWEWWRSGVYQSTADWFAPSINRVVLHSERSEYVDYARRGGDNDGAPLTVNGDYLFHELVELSPARR